MNALAGEAEFPANRGPGPAEPVPAGALTPRTRDDPLGAIRPGVGR